MTFPAPDIGVARFPGPDAGLAAFPPLPIPVFFIDSETVVDILSSSVVIGVPWHQVETVVDLGSSVIAVPSVMILAQTSVDVLSTVQQVFDVVVSETVVDILSTSAVTPSPTAAAGTVVDIGSAVILAGLAAVVVSQTSVEIESDITSVPTTSFTGTSTVDVNSTSTAVPVGVINSTTSVDITSAGTITAFTPSGMTKNGDLQLFDTPNKNVTGWTADPGSTVSGNGVVARGNKSDAVVQAAFSWQNDYNGATTMTFRILKNGVQIHQFTSATSTPNAVTNTPMSSSPPFAVAVGDVITVTARSSVNSGYYTIKGGAATYVRIT
ncbi:hypothetical protein ABH922_002972 [Rhodococcus sp. 27YEA15]|uniref:hypothetical protein n=1 Tax=Rhodococcus sp. 27YEA15 TaxID=3156259 RepID=UPI003C7A6CA8